MDWTRQVIDLHLVPGVGEYIKVPGGDGAAEYHKICMVIRVAEGGDVDAEVYGNKIGPTLIQRLGWQSTLIKDKPATDTSPDAPRDEWLTVAEAAKARHVSERTIRRLCRSGKLEAVPFGTGKRPNWRISRKVLDNLKPSAGTTVAASQPTHRIRRNRQRGRVSESVEALLSKY